jgi:hypothetical protein
VGGEKTFLNEIKKEMQFIHNGLKDCKNIEDLVD